ncbi:MAG: HU family DNA-binding protein, partial [Romboutsia sp.]|nr:HU family DNA-binding protein [Romboutsia sp.]
EALTEGEKISLVGFGSFEAKERKAREIRNPRNPEEVIQIKESKVVSFKSGAPFRKKINESK